MANTRMPGAPMYSSAYTQTDFDGPHLVPREELAASHRLTLTCFPGVREEMTEEEVASYIPPRRGGVQVLSHRGVPVSQIGIYHSQVNLYGSPLRIASIGGVCTHPDYRGLGLATRLLDYCTHKLVAEGARLMLISGTRNLYARAGCVAAQDFEYVQLTAGQLSTFPQGALEPGQPPHYGGASPHYCGATLGKVGIRPATAADASLCARIYQAEPVHFVRRIEEFAKHFSHLEEYPRAEDWVVEILEQPVAFLFLGVPWEYWHAPETGVREVVEYAGSRIALARGLAQVMAQSKLAQLRLLVPRQDKDLLQLLAALGATGDATSLTGHTMSIVNFPGLMSDLRPYVKARLTQEQRRGLRFMQHGERCAIVRGQERLELDTTAITPLVMGPQYSPAVAAALPTTVGRPLAEITSALFPLPSFLPGLNFR